MDRFVFILLIAVNLFAQSVTIQYDDGGAPNEKITLGVDGWFFTTRFTAPELPAVLEEAHYYLSQSNKANGFLFCIYEGGSEKPGSELISPIAMQAVQSGWNVIDLRHLNVTVDDDFFLSIQYNYKDEIGLGAERREPHWGRAFDSDC